MPELPEIECLKRGLDRAIVGRRVVRAELHRPDFAHIHTRTPTPGDLLEGCTLGPCLRLGKQLALVAEDGRTVCVHLGMSGQLIHLPPGVEPAQRDHIHLSWVLDDGSRLIFRDPRRFGGVWCFETVQDLRAGRWSALGPDALAVTSRELRDAASRSSRAVKTALLDQRALAGVGNIYADEALHRAKLHPLRRCDSLTPGEWTRLARAVRDVLRQAIRGGGSTLRDYRNAEGGSGGFQSRHRVYGRDGEPCRRCGGSVVRQVIGQRSSHFCPCCQPRSTGVADRDRTDYPQATPRVRTRPVGPESERVSGGN